MRNGLTNSPRPAGATVDVSGAYDLITLGSGLTLTGSVLSASGGGSYENFIIDGGSASTSYPSNSFIIDFGAAS